ncbi:hypothetical protein B5F74_11645 [Collinsella sp. An271]|uniref:gamma-glutamylcyclotransferase n=1 Tax=Collinsella sp. An271 TaxID=1965616 RepID=UPI000B39D12A|nr:gamma-glutamylcyclotransferase [Collinsella sp. An271]OUO57828.1 hypothetical protein B5F74_11645 [Collinsella sp. An271]
MELKLIRDPFIQVNSAGPQEKMYRRPDTEQIDRMDTALAHFRDSEPVDSDDFAAALDQILDFQREDGSFSYFSDYRMDSDCRVDFVYRPSYACCQILMRAVLAMHEPPSPESGLYDALRRGLTFCCGRGLAGHGFDSEVQQIDDLRNFASAGYPEFADRLSDICPDFCTMVASIISGYEQRLLGCRTIVGFGTDITVRVAELLELFGREALIPVFVYGSLMEGMRNASILKGCAHRGPARLNGHALYSLGSFPGIKPSDDGGCTLGEVRMVDARTLEKLDELEDNGKLYRRAGVEVVMQGMLHAHDRKCQAWTYEYLGEVESATRVPEQLQPWSRTIALRKTHVWYVAYGSCMSYERFMCYLAGGTCKDNGRTYEGCSDPTPPICTASMPLFHDVYFGNESRSWGGAGVAFLDVDNPGFTHARAYLITREQYEQVRDQEGRSGQWYGREVELGTRTGIPMLTFTSADKRPHNAPSEAYLSTMRLGISEAFPGYASAEDPELLLAEHLK